MPSMTIMLYRVQLALLGALRVPSCAGGQKDPEAAPPPKDHPVTILPTSQLSGQTVAILPITMVVSGPALGADAACAAYRDHLAALAEAYSVMGEAIMSRAPEVSWVP